MQNAECRIKAALPGGRACVRAAFCVHHSAFSISPAPSDNSFEMDCSIYRLRQRDLLTICVLALLALGVVMVQSASTTLTGSVVRAPAPDPTAPRLPGPVPVSGLMATTAADGIELSWDAAAEPETVAFHIYRGPSTSGPFEKLDTVRRRSPSVRGSRSLRDSSGGLSPTPTRCANSFPANGS